MSDEDRIEIEGENRCKHCYAIIPWSKRFCDSECQRKRKAFEAQARAEAISFHNPTNR